MKIIPIKYKLFCDMDGVLCDFDRQFKKVSGLTSQEYLDKYSKSKMWEVINAQDAEWWATIPWMSDGKKLWDYIKRYSPQILTAPSRLKCSEIGKTKWVEKEIEEKPKINFSQDKWEFSGSKKILIDDRIKNISPWIERNGIGILHETADKTIERLKEYLP